MAGLKIHISNKMEILADRISDLVTKPLISAMSREVIVVQSRGMERWISMEIARHNGICANVDFPFPNEAIQDIFKNMLQDFPETSGFEPEIMTFRIMKILPSCLHLPGFESLKTYLLDDEKQLKLFQLSGKIADTFDKYLIFRPDMILEWEEETDAQAHDLKWQPHLWRELAADNNNLHQARLREKLFEKFRLGEGHPEHLPERISMVGISHLPLFHLGVFEAVSKLVEVNLFLLNPCREYWADIVSDHEIKKIRDRYAFTLDTEKDLFLEKGNNLLSSMGKLGRDFHSLISGFDCETYDQFEEMPQESLLSSIQADILNLRNRYSPIEDKEKKSDKGVIHERQQEPDDSIQIHSCHSPLREMEVLHDNLLAMFEADPGLAPGDILVMTPDIDAYAPFIQAVFYSQPDERIRIPFSIADQSALNESPVIDRYLSILDLKESRFGATKVLDLLELPEIRNRFNIDEQDVEVIAKWVRETNIRWGIDAEDRKKSSLPGFHENTWRAGMERLLLGYAMPDKDHHMYAGIVPYDSMEGEETVLLGRFMEFLEKVFESTFLLGKKRTLSDWSTVLKKILEQLFQPNEITEREIQLIRALLDDLAEKENPAGFHETIEFEVVRSFLGINLKMKNFGYGFISGGVTFCAMLPMRSIPAKVICLAGMNNDAFPRDMNSLGFDLVSAYPRPGDRSRRNDDRYLFLEALISARQRFYLSYIGQSIQDNTVIPPSVLVSELCDYLNEGFGVHEDRMIIRHRLQPFSPGYFRKENDKLFSYSKENLDASRRLLDHEEPVSFISTMLSEPSGEWKTLNIDRLCSFFKNPSKFLLEKRLGIYLKKDLPVQNDREHFNLDGLEKYRIGQDLVKRGLSGLDTGNLLQAYRSMGRLPHGVSGDFLYADLSSAADEFVTKVKAYTKDISDKILDIDIEISGYHILGKVSGLDKNGLVRFRYSKLKPKDFIESWIYHVVLGCLEHESLQATTCLVGRDAVWEFEPVENHEDILKELLDMYWGGLKQPLHFFPEASFEYVQKMCRGGKTSSRALAYARNKWQGTDFSKGEVVDPYFDLCFHKNDPMDKVFRETADRIFLPVFKSMKKID